jgi:LruC domain-containing protein
MGTLRAQFLLAAAALSASLTAGAQSYPACDAVVYSPAQGVHGTVLFEDNWPDNGDLDFNDQAVTYSFELATVSSDHRVIALDATFNVLAVGATFHNGLYLHLPGAHIADVDSASFAGSDGSALSAVPVAGESELVFEIVNDTRTLFARQDSFINTSDASATQTASKAVELHVVFKAPVSLDTAAAPFDLFIARSANYAWQIHKPEFAGTSAATSFLAGKLGSGDDGSNSGLNAGRYFVNTLGMPFALQIPATLDWAQETRAIDSVYRDLLGFASSAGGSNTNWYSSGNVDSGRLFTTGAGATTPPSPIFVSAQDPFAACVPFIATGSMKIARANAASATLRDGRVLVVGGDNASGEVAQAEIYDPATGQFTLTGPLLVPRSYTNATVLPGPAGLVLVAGGVIGDVNTGSSIADAEIYDPSSGTFTATGPMLQPVFGPGAILLNNGTVLFTGGHISSINEGTSRAEIYDPATGHFSFGGGMHAPRDLATQTIALLQNGQVFVTGGYGQQSAEIYDPTLKTFTLTAGPPNTGRINGTATTLANGQVLIAGGLDRYGGIYQSAAELYDPATGQFTVTGSLHTERSDATATLLPDGDVLIAGGFGQGGARTTGERYSAGAGTFSIAGTMTTPRTRTTAQLLPTGDVLFGGGIDLDGSVTSAAELYQ